MFEPISMAPADPILGLTEAFQNDPRPEKVNLGVGVYKDEAGTTPILGTVKTAEQRLVDNEKTKSYLAISGLPEYGKQVQRLIFGDDHQVYQQHRACTAQAPGGTGALRIAAEFLVRQAGAKTIWVSNPTWANHSNVFGAAGLNVKEYRYYDAANHNLDFAGMLAALKQVPAGDIVLLHACCHNPTGIDLTMDQWQQVAAVAKQQGWTPLFDFAYQGFANGLDEDAAGLRWFANQVPELLVASSFSKNFGLYNERTGAVTLVAATQDIAERSFSQMKRLIRGIYSNPPAHGAKVVSTILGDEQLFAAWEAEVTAMRERIHTMRSLFVQTLASKGVNRDFSFIEQQNGMFSFSGLNKEQVARLKDEFGVYIVGSGRISVAGMTHDNMDVICSAIAGVL